MSIFVENVLFFIRAKINILARLIVTVFACYNTVYDAIVLV